MKLALISYSILSLLATPINGVPSADMGYSPYARASRNGIQGADVITALSLSVTFGSPVLSSSAKSGEAGDAIISSDPRPTTFFVKNGHLYAYVNQTAVLHVNVIDPQRTKAHIAANDHQYWPSEESPEVKFSSSQDHAEVVRHREGLMKVKIGHKKEGIRGMFYYALDSLHFGLRQGSGKGEHSTNNGLWWACEDVPTWNNRGGKALYIEFGHGDHIQRPRPAGCEAFTLHSFGEHE